MCGIIGITSGRPIVQHLLAGLQRLEYRGYDSTGLALQTQDGLKRLRAPGKLQALREVFARTPLEGICGIGHTRWATHGVPNERNAHPQGGDQVMVVHNGIIENFLSLKNELITGNLSFESETDTEVLVHLVEQALLTQPELQDLSKLSLLLRSVFQRLEGSFACALLLARFPDTLICYRQGNSPLTVGYGIGEMFCGSDAIALSGLSDTLAYLEDKDLALLTPHKIFFWDAQHQGALRPRVPNPIAPQSMSKNHHAHFMRKEIEEQPCALQHLLDHPFIPKLTACKPEHLTSLTLVACGTAYYAGCVASSWFETYAQLRTDVEIASEFRYRRPPLPEKGMVIFISQSGETVDTLGALAYAQEAHQQTLAIVNVPSSCLDRLADISLQTQAGPEIGVASTKAFTSQLLLLAFLALDFGAKRRHLSPADLDLQRAELKTIPELLKQTLLLEPAIQALAHTIKDASSILYLGRGSMAALACEGALKLKELSYIHAEGYPAGEMKHGPIALLEENLPVIVFAPFNPLFEKILGNLQEVAARGAPLMILTDEIGRAHLNHLKASFLILPPTSCLTAPFAYAVALQLLAYHVACLKGTDVDQPRNLAKSVTVE